MKETTRAGRVDFDLTMRSATHKSARSSTQSNTDADGFTAEERAAMKERAKEMKAARSRKTVEGTAEVLEKIPAMAEGDRVLAMRLHEIITKAAPELTPKTWYGMPACAGPQGRLLLPGRSQPEGPRRRPLAFRTPPTSTTAPCGRRHSR